MPLLDMLGSAKDLIVWILDNLDKLELSEDAMQRSITNLKYIQQIINDLGPQIKNEDADMEKFKEILAHLEKAYKSITTISGKSIVKKFFTASSMHDHLEYDTEDEIKSAYSKLILFIDSKHLTMFCDTVEYQNEMLQKSAILQENFKAGLKIIEDTSIRRPPAPPGFAIQECKNSFLLSWKPCGGTVDEYEVCYDEQEGYTFPVGKVTSIEIGHPRVSTKKPLYTMKVRGINKGGPGEWSKALVAQFTKPLPQKPDISKLLLRSTVGDITVKIPKPLYNTESPVTCIEISYVSATSAKWYTSEFEIDPLGNNNLQTFGVKELEHDSRYSFRVRSKNAEGWSKYSDITQDHTLALPPKPARPDDPIIKICSKSKVELGVKVPKNVHSVKFSIIEWNVKGLAFSLHTVTDPMEINEYHESDKSMVNCVVICMENVDPDKMYNLQILAKNEGGWSDPSKPFLIDISMPIPPKNFRASSEQSHSLIKVRWDAPDSEFISHYEIAKRSKNGTYDQKPVKAPSNKFSATYTKLKPNTLYCFRIRSCSETRKSEWSDEIAVSTRPKGIRAVLSRSTGSDQSDDEDAITIEC